MIFWKSKRINIIKTKFHSYTWGKHMANIFDFQQCRLNFRIEHFFHLDTLQARGNIQSFSVILTCTLNESYTLSFNTFKSLPVLLNLTLIILCSFISAQYIKSSLISYATATAAFKPLTAVEWLLFVKSKYWIRDRSAYKRNASSTTWKL